MQCSQNSETYRIHYEETLKDLDNAKKEIKSLTELKDWYNKFDIPPVPLETIEKKLKMADRFTLTTLMEYFYLDNFLLVKNLAKVTNSDNSANIIAYRDWGIARNDAHIKTLEKLSKITFYDRLENKTKNVTRKDTKKKTI